MKKILLIFSAITILMSATAIIGKSIFDTVKAKSSAAGTEAKAYTEAKADADSRGRDWTLPIEVKINNSAAAGKGYYRVYQEEEYIGGFGNYDDALNFAVQYEKAYIIPQHQTRRIWDNYPPFIVYTNNKDYQEFYSFSEAAAYAKSFQQTFMYYGKDDRLIWSNADPLPLDKKISGITRIEQMPELPRGCEVTSLAMLLNYKGINVSKLELAGKVEKNPVSISRSGGKIYCGDPNEGFIGDMYDFSKFGLGVYHAPIAKLLSEYFPNSTLDLTGCEFEDLFYSLCMNRPVWVIINSTYGVLPANEFDKWITPSGKEIDITYKEHSVLVTGYDADNIYFLDPLNKITNVNRKAFISMWEQMGRQAVTVTK